MASQPRRTRANPSPSGLRELPIAPAPKPRRATRRQAIETEDLEHHTGDSDQQASFSEQREQSPTPNPSNSRARAGTSRTSSADLESSKPQGASTKGRRHNLRSGTRSASPEDTQTPPVAPVELPEETRADPQSKKRARDEQPVAPENDSDNADEEPPAKLRKRTTRSKKAAPSKKTKPFKEEPDAQVTPVPSNEAPQEQRIPGAINVTENEDDTHPLSETLVETTGDNPTNNNTVEDAVVEIEDSLEKEPTPSIQTLHFRKSFGSQQPSDVAAKDIPRKQDLANHKTPNRKNTIARTRTEPRRGDILKLSERTDVDILLDPAKKVLYHAWLREQYCQVYNRSMESFNQLSVESQGSMINLMRKKLFKPSRTFAQYLLATGNGPVTGRASKQEALDEHINHDDTEEEDDSMELSMMPTIDSPESISHNLRTPGGNDQGDEETVQVQGSQPSMRQSQSNSIICETASPAQSPVITKETLLMDHDVIEAAKVVRQVFAADRSRRGKPFPNAERLGQFLDQYQQEEVASSRKFTTPRKTETTRDDSRAVNGTSKGIARFTPSSPANDEGLGDENSESEKGASPTTDDDYNESTIRTPSTSASSEMQKSRGWLSSFTSTITSPLKAFGIRRHSPAAVPASQPVAHGGLSFDEFATPTRKPASQKFGVDRNAGIKAAVDRRKERAKSAEQAQVPIHLRGVMTPEARAALYEQEDDVHGEARHQKRAAAQQGDSEWTEEYIDERGYDVVATWKWENGKRKRMVTQRLKHPTYTFPDSSDDDTTDVEQSEAGSPARVQLRSSSKKDSGPPRERIFQQARRAIGLDTPPSAEELEQLARDKAIYNGLGDPHHARPYRGKYFRTSAGSDHAAAESGNVFEDQTHEQTRKVGPMFAGFRPPSSGSSSGESAGESEEHFDPDVEAFGRFLKKSPGKPTRFRTREEMAQLNREEYEAKEKAKELAALQQKQWTQSPPPKPKPSNATLPGKQVSDEEAAKAREARVQAEKYLPKKPSRLREVEQASPNQKESIASQDFGVTEETILNMGIDTDIMSALMSIEDGIIVNLDLPTERFSIDRDRTNSVDKAVKRTLTYFT
ncbi:hypothetical protein PVAG01_01705 [Phlyctema vagabunda]|uniref:Uncharacterized protein n=1 Tax=Phlyctema vagabunda TaxID=108571 RepID=A0ABR4PZ56_9HELO